MAKRLTTIVLPVAALLTVLWMFLGFLPGGSTPGDVAHESVEAPEHDPSDSEPSGAERLPVSSEEPAVEQARSAQVASSDPSPEELDPAESKRFLEELRAAVEMIVYEKLDPGAILDAAIQLAALPADHAIPEPDVTGRLRFPLIGTPEGVDATLVVAKPQNPRYSKFIGLELTLEAPSEEYYLEGAVRKAPRVQISTWTGVDGSAEHFAILASLEPSKSGCKRAGIPFDEGTYLYDLMYTVDLRNPSEAKMSVTRLVQGSLTDDTIPLNLEGLGWPRLDGIAKLNRMLEAIHKEVSIRQPR